MDLTLIRLIPVSIANYRTLQNMARFYVYDMSEYLGSHEGWGIPLDGLYECIDFKIYWNDPETQFPFLIYYKDEIAGFVIVDKKGVNENVNFNIAQFFVIRKFKRHGIGKYVAKQCFDMFTGTWSVMCLPDNTGAYKFWYSIISEYTKGKFEEYPMQTVAHLDDTYNVFQFCSNNIAQSHAGV